MLQVLQGVYRFLPSLQQAAIGQQRSCEQLTRAVRIYMRLQAYYRLRLLLPWLPSVSQAASSAAPKPSREASLNQPHGSRTRRPDFTVPATLRDE